MPPATTGESGDDVVEDVALSLFESSTIGVDDGGENDGDNGDSDDDCEESLSLLFAPSLFDSVEDDDEEDDGHRGGDNGEGGGDGNDDAAAIGVEDKDALLFNLELELAVLSFFCTTVWALFCFLVASTLPPSPPWVPSRVVLRCRFCRPLFCFDELPEEHTLPF